MTIDEEEFEEQFEDDDSWAIWALVRRIGANEFESASTITHTLPNEYLTNMVNHLEHALSIVRNEQRVRVVKV